ncbi:Protein 4.1 [Labeo rohita]|uniref:Protein 4.1 n=1 Tax=Labeo rohita TaxID=84645 RepID=A0ABQ8LRL3_LABRO|nr:Protein 4.1 [Labeo rohita]
MADYPMPLSGDDGRQIRPQDVDKTQTEIMRHHTSISELKRSFMESVPEPRPSEWDKRLSTHSPFRTASINGQMQPDVSTRVKKPPLLPLHRVAGGISESCPGSQSCPPPLSSIAPSPPRSSSSPQAGVYRSVQRGARSLAPRPSSAEAYYIMYQSQT